MKKLHLITYCITLVSGFFLVLQVSCQNAGPFVFEGQIKGANESKLILNQLQGHKEFKISELTAGKDGAFTLRLDEMPRAGQYRLRIDPGSRNGILDFLFTDEKHISFVTHVNFLTDSIRFAKSKINDEWYNYFRTKDEYETRLSILEHLLNIYPADDRFYPEVIKEFNLLQDELEQKVGLLITSFPNTLLARYVSSDQSPRINTALSPEERQEFIRYNYLNNVDFNDTLLLYTDIFPGKALSYIMLFRGQRLDRDQQELEFIKAADNLLPLAMMQPTVYNYLLGYTISGFEQIGMEKVLMYISENYPVDETCISDQDSGELQRRMEGYRMLAPGNKAPGISTKDINDKPYMLNQDNAEHVLIVFWASWCPHCTTMLPDIKSLAVQLNSNAGPAQSQPLKVVSVSIDHDKDEYMDYLNKHGFINESLSRFWVNICDYQAWESKVAEDYYLYATPTMVLVDQSGNIVGKPSGIQELIKLLGI
jgi:thiol-disulfide isomerase/thioredoxin